MRRKGAKPYRARSSRVDRDVIASLDQDADLSTAEVVSFLASRVCTSPAELRACKDKLRKKVLYATKEQGWPARASRSGYRLLDVITWARKNWPGLFDDVPIVYNKNHPAHDSDSIAVTDQVIGHVFPGDVARCHELLRKLYRLVDDLQSKLKDCDGQSAALKHELQKAKRRR